MTKAPEVTARTPSEGGEEWFASARAGDPEAFCQLAGLQEGRLYRQALGLSRHAATAEDLVAETLTEAWRSLGRFDGRCRFSTWLYAILLHRFQKHVRRQRSRPAAVEQLTGVDRLRGEELMVGVADEGPIGPEVLMLAERSEVLQEALAGLGEKHRTVVALRFYEGASLAEIAAALDLPLGTVKSRLHAGLRTLRGVPEVVNLFTEDRES